MMKLTVAFLAALAAADAAEARTHRQARRQYGYGDGYGAVSPSPKPETPSVSSAISPPYNPSSADTFKTSLPVDAASSYVPTPTPQVPEGGKSSAPVESPKETPKESPKETPVVPASSSVATPVVASSAPPAGDYGAGYPGSKPSPSSSAKVPSNSGVAPPSSAVPSGAYPSGGAGKPESSKVPSNSGVLPSSGVVPSGTGNAVYPTGTAVPPSSTPLTDMVTKTIYSTQIYHISSSLTTKVVPVGTTVCAKDEASKTPSPSAPAATPVKVSSQVPYSEVVTKVTETLVYTVGVGSTAHPVTTEVVKTSTSTLYKTVVVSASKPGYPQGKPDESTSTKTIKSTTTSTKYVTVKPTPTGNSNVPVGEQGKPAGPAGGASDCAKPVTVTVTAKETVYVTKEQEKPKPTPGAEKPGSGYPTNPQKPSGGADKPTKPSATPSAHYPIANGTNPYPAGPTGFKTSTKPAVPVGTGGSGYGKPSSLPAFSFASEVPAVTPSSTPKVPSNGKTTPAASATPSAAYPPAGGNYGSGYGEVPAVSSAKPSETPKVPSNNQSSSPVATPTPAGNYGSGYGTY